MIQNANRYDTNRKIKQILVSHSTDVSKVFFSFSGKTARFSGCFISISGRGLKYGEVEALCKTLSNISGIRFLTFDMEDWAISAGMGSLNIVRKAVASSGASGARKSLHIKSDEPVKEFLEDQQER